jgi:hypothetical protein
MVKRKSRKIKSRKAVRKTAKRKIARKKRASGAVDSRQKATLNNRRAQWDVYRDLQKRADQAWSKLCSDVKRKADPQVILEDRNNLLLLLGECNYMAGECMRMRYSSSQVSEFRAPS